MMLDSMEYLFIYNANTDVVSKLVDYAHKVIKPSTYKCNLCLLTHHNQGERNAWKQFKKSTNAKLSFWHIKQFEEAFEIQFQYPVVLMRKKASFEVVINKEELAKFKEVDELIRTLEAVIGS